MEKTKWHWDIWIAVLNMTINSYSLKKMEDVLIKDYGCVGINHKTLFLWRHKLIHAVATPPMPKLSGIIQVDETFIREEQNHKILENLYKNNMIDYISNRGYLTYEEFNELKIVNGLSLSRVNNFITI